jgi:hypothetical protein
MGNRPLKEDRWPCIPLASESLCCQKAPFCLPNRDFLSGRARGIDPLCLSIEPHDTGKGELGRGNRPFSQPMFLPVRTAVASMLSLSCKTSPFPEQMSEVASTGAKQSASCVKIPETKSFALHPSGFPEHILLASTCLSCLMESSSHHPMRRARFPLSLKRVLPRKKRDWRGDGQSFLNGCAK